MTTEPKAEGVEAVATYGMRRKGTTAIIGVVPEKIHAQPLDPKRSADYMRDYEEVPLYTHPTTPAVEALARAAEAVYVDSNNEDLWNALEAALAHPEIAALLKGETK